MKLTDTNANLDFLRALDQDLDDLDTYTVHMGAAQTDKICVEFKEVKKIIDKYRLIL